jgi:hypothetical protein
MDRAPAPKWIGAAAAVSFACSLITVRLDLTPQGVVMFGDTKAPIAQSMLVVDDFSSAALLGVSTIAMLIGHSYLISPTMSLQPLTRLLLALFVCLLVRLLVSATGAGFWATTHSLTRLNDVSVLLPLRWVIGFIAPAVLGTMAWQTAKIRSTQSATGILYVVVIFCFVGEAISQLLFDTTGYTL